MDTKHTEWLCEKRKFELPFGDPEPEFVILCRDEFRISRETTQLLEHRRSSNDSRSREAIPSEQELSVPGAMLWSIGDESRRGAAAPLLGMAHEINSGLQPFNAATKFAAKPPVIGVEKGDISCIGARNSDVA
jgi:hypothetical protein